ncbi:MAG: hypothetical protein R6U13_07600, partial [Desulfatiglandaceae bacterium]
HTYVWTPGGRDESSIVSICWPAKLYTTSEIFDASGSENEIDVAALNGLGEFCASEYEAVLSRKGRRLNLGTATGVSTQDKKGVLFVEDSPGQGQYYLSIWFSNVEA